MRAQLIIRGLCCLSLFQLHAGEQRFWDNKDPVSWTPQEVTQFTTASPWAKQVAAELTSNDSNMAASMPRSSGRGRSRGGSGLPSPSTLPKLQGLVQWVSAKPMQQVLKLHLPASVQGRYVICVSGFPLSANTTEAVENTTLQVKRGEAVHPETAYQDPADTSAMYFAFLPSTINVPGGKTAIFSMVVPPYAIKARFNAAEMKYRGEPAF